jgi:hypothetical protein
MSGQFVGRHTSCHKYSLRARHAGEKPEGEEWRGGSPPRRPLRNFASVAAWKRRRDGKGDAPRSARPARRRGRALIRYVVLVVEMAGFAHHRVEVAPFAAGDDHGAAVEVADGSEPSGSWRERMRTAGWRSTASGSIARQAPLVSTRSRNEADTRLAGNPRRQPQHPVRRFRAPAGSVRVRARSPDGQRSDLASSKAALADERAATGRRGKALSSPATGATRGSGRIDPR